MSNNNFNQFNMLYRITTKQCTAIEIIARMWRGSAVYLWAGHNSATIHEVMYAQSGTGALTTNTQRTLTVKLRHRGGGRAGYSVTGEW